MRWKLIVALAILTVIVSFALVFTPGREEPYLLGLPFILWSSFLSTVVLVILTFLGSRYFPYKDN